MILAQTVSENGEAVLREGPAGFEIILDGQFLMSSASGYSSEVLVQSGLDRLSRCTGRTKGINVLIAGMGLGFSLNTAIKNPTVAGVTVAELDSAIIEWHRRGLIPLCTEALSDPRTQIVHCNFLDFIRQTAERYHVIAVDIDNGPEWLSHEENKQLYTGEMLKQIKSLLHPGGVLTVWSADAAPRLKERLADLFGEVSETAVADHDGCGKTIEAYIYLCQNKDFEICCKGV